ncbi:MAG: hypothetical protein ACW99J_14615 [Candidatus Thorarchaeota archaeon]|jgi:hypothetical protein
MTRSVLAAAVIAAFSLFALKPVFAKDYCKSSKYMDVLPYKGFKFGMSPKKVKKLIAKKYRRKATATIAEKGTRLDLDFKDRSVFDWFVFRTTNGAITSLSVRYSDEFQKKLGGSAKAVGALLKKLREKLGALGNMDKVQDSYRVMWPDHDGARLILVAKDPSTIIMTVMCDELADIKANEAADSANFGF